MCNAILWFTLQACRVHVMAMAVQKLYPDAKVTIGPWIENGFYYDFDTEPLTDKDLKRSKKEMDRIIGKNLPATCKRRSF
ncbi:hypothetical protein GLYMA_U011002v4 [Glycine max]|uniref:Threonine--tRNA ligase n=2 Tax=Glycine subgen. Soja TaxID=1462606 RepID=K7LYN8_SOYBN|nr:hypothetical protein GLYMA_U011002v4 [Glycine max]KAH1094715.1 hypothetical protein GYH30_040140 [Glycine max]RZB70540.1 Threonine--tRNA ligase, chloroplastic/mitochondrial 2 isoform A [Glycine soja]